MNNDLDEIIDLIILENNGDIAKIEEELGVKKDDEDNKSNRQQDS